jgi:hypothetical protein
MAERALEARLQAVAQALDAEAPAFDPAVLRAAGRRRVRPALVVLAAAAALIGVVAAPAAVSALGRLLSVESVPELGPVAHDVAPSFLGRPVAVGAARAAVPFRLRTIDSLGEPDAAYVRNDIAGAMATLSYEGGSIRLTQWRAADVQAHAAVVPVSGTAEEVTIGSARGMWIAGAARGTFTLVGADGAVHRELFEVAEGTLLWQDGGIALLLQGAGTKENALLLAAQVR